MKKRNYGIDLLRILSILQILTLHTLGHGGVLSNLTPSAPLYKYAWFFEISCYGAVNCFALISGYVGVKSNYTYKKIFPLWLQVCLYSGLITTIFFYYKPSTVTAAQTILSFFPVFNYSYWFFTCYFLLMLLMPVLNGGINSLTKKQSAKTVITLILVATLFNVLPKLDFFSFLTTQDIFSLKSGYSAIWLILLYIVGGCISKHQLLKKIPTLLLIVVNIIVIGFTFWFKIYSSLNTAGVDATSLVNYCSPTIVIGALTSLEIFSRIKFANIINTIISFLSPLTFASYLIQDHPLVREYIINGRFKNLVALNVLQFVIQLFAIVIITYFVCVLIDLIRYWLFKAVKLK